MDAVGLSVLTRELAADCAVLAGAAENAARWIGQPAAGGLQACADRLGELIGTATRMSAALPAWCDRFAAAVRREQGWQEEGRD